jgi:hypothetical protein
MNSARNRSQEFAVARNRMTGIGSRYSTAQDRFNVSPAVFRRVDQAKTIQLNESMNGMNTHSSLLACLTLAPVICLPLSSAAADMVVTSLADDGPGSLRDAIAAANTNADPDVITFHGAFSGQFVRLNSQLLLSNHVTIDASGLADGITITSSASAGLPRYMRILEIAESAVVELNRIAIMGGYASERFAGGGALSSYGGAILLNANGGTLTLNDCTLALNYAERDGGAIAMMQGSSAVVTLNHCTVAHNAAVEGGGILCAGGQLTVNNCTFTGNTAAILGGAIRGNCAINNSSIYNNVALLAGGGIHKDAGTGTIVNNSTIANNSARFGGGVRAPVNGPSLTNCTVSGNTAYVSGGGISTFGSGGVWINSVVAGNIASSNSNFTISPSFVSNSRTNGDPSLAPLGDYGGTMLTMPPLAGSPAIDAGNDSVTNSLTTDQRGSPRLAGAHADIGAVESQEANASEAPFLKLSFTSSPGTDFTVLAATNVIGAWSRLGRATQSTPGQYRFTDIFAPEYPRRFYQVTSP